MTCRIVKVIFSDDATRGKGTEGDLVRRVPALYTLGGDLICSYDCGPDGKTPISVVYDYALRKLERQS